MTRHNYTTSMGELTVLVMEPAEWEEFLQDVRQYKSPKNAITEDNIAAFNQAGMVPLIQKGSATEYLFEKYEIKTDKLSVCRQGLAQKFMEQLGLSKAEKTEKIEKEFEKFYESLPRTMKDVINKHTKLIVGVFPDSPIPGLEAFLNELTSLNKGVEFDVEGTLEQMGSSAAFTWIQYGVYPQERRKTEWEGYIKRLLTGVAGSYHALVNSQRN